VRFIMNMLRRRGVGTYFWEGDGFGGHRWDCCYWGIISQSRTSLIELALFPTPINVLPNSA